MTILRNMFAAKNSFRCQPMSIIPNILPGIKTCASLEWGLLLAQRTSSFLGITSRSITYEYASDDEMEKKFPNLTPEERVWIRRLSEATNLIGEFHETKFRHTIYFLREDDKKLPSMKVAKFSYRELWATNRLVAKIEDVARRLIDENVDDKCQVFYLRDPIEIHVRHYFGRDGYNECDHEVIDYDQCWQSLLKSSKQPLAQKLREKLNQAGITPETFAQTVDYVYFKLQYGSDYWTIERVDFGPDDIKGVLNNLPLNDTQYECIKILFNLEESEKWQI